MPNPNPKTDHLSPHQFQPEADRALGKVIGTRFPLDVEAVLLQLPDRQDYIRAAVEAKLRADGRL